MVKRTKVIQVWERKKLGSKAVTPDRAKEYLKDYTQLTTTGVSKREEFIEWVRKNGCHSYGYLYVAVEVVIDEDYDPHGSGLTSIDISSPQYYAMIHRQHGGWGENKYGEHNYLPDFSWAAFVPKGYPDRIVKYDGTICEEVKGGVLVE
jgi:hypothetical protein